MKINKYDIISGGLTMLATISVLAMHSAFWSYQPKEPKCLKS